LYTGDVDSFTKIVKSTPVPIVIAGGPKAKTDMDILEMTEDAMKAGAKGVTYGRNIFEHKNPGKMTHALAGIIFRKETAKEAAKHLDEK
jgi:fructose-bisphosphate aldolase/2-amino-3,7-dideoxy-D-threo-hept-6-ulosonate synthase